MSGTYRDETESLRVRVEQLEVRLGERERQVEELRGRLGDQDAVFARLKGVIDAHGDKRERRVGCWSLTGGALLACLGVAVGVAVAKRSAAALPPPPTPTGPAAQVPTPPAAFPSIPRAVPLPAAPPPIGNDLCARLGVRLTLDGDDAEAPAQTAQRDLAGHKYRKDATRAAFFTVHGGPLYVHGWGDFLPSDTGTTHLTMLTVITKGETGGYELARGGRSVLEVMGADGKRIWGRFEADVSRVADTTREPPFGTPVVRMRGNFCLPALPADPSDTGP